MTTSTSCQVEEISTAFAGAAKAARRPMALLLFDLICHFVRHDDAVLFVVIIKSELGSPGDRLPSEERQLVDVPVVVVVGHGIHTAVRLAGVVDEPSR